MLYSVSSTSAKPVDFAGWFNSYMYHFILKTGVSTVLISTVFIKTQNRDLIRIKSHELSLSLERFFRVQYY